MATLAAGAATPTLTATPTCRPVAGVYSAAQSVTLSCATSGATIRYTTDGSTPSETAGTVYSSAVSITSTTHLQAIAYLSGMYDSPIANGVYTIGTTSSTPGTIQWTNNGVWAAPTSKPATLERVQSPARWQSHHLLRLLKAIPDEYWWYSATPSPSTSPCRAGNPWCSTIGV